MALADDRSVKEPGPEHPITIEPADRRTRVTVGGELVADSERAFTLREAGYAPVHYFPPEDVDFALLEPTDHASWCPYKGEADYFSVPAGGERSVNAAWRYRQAFPAVAEIAGYIAFYRDRVDALG
jgi:uncharacterized protein (DUF427 family)